MSTNAHYLENSSKSIEKMKVYLDLFQSYKDKLTERMKEAKDQHTIDIYLDYYNNVSEVYNTMALFNAIESVLYDLKVVDPNDLNDKVLQENISKKIFEHESIPESLKEFVKKHLNVMLDNKFNITEFIMKKTDEISRLKFEI